MHRAAHSVSMLAMSRSSSSSKHCGRAVKPIKGHVWSSTTLCSPTVDGMSHDCGIDCRYLCDEALDTEALREALSLRVDGAEEVKKEMREEVAEDKRKLKVRGPDHHQC